MNGNPFENITGRLVAAEMARAKHKPGLKVTFRDGTIYIVQPSGAWKRTSERKCNEVSFHYHEITNKAKLRRLA